MARVAKRKPSRADKKGIAQKNLVQPEAAKPESDPLEHWRVVKYLRKVLTEESQKRPDANPEGLRDEVIGKLNQQIERLKRKYPNTNRSSLAVYLTLPVDEQPLWFSSGESGAMTPDERLKVMHDFHSLTYRNRKVPGPKGNDNQFYRGMKRQTILTYKQWQVARLTVEGLDIKVIAKRLNIDPRMVKTHLQAIRRKAKLTRNAEIVRWFLGY